MDEWPITTWIMLGSVVVAFAGVCIAYWMARRKADEEEPAVSLESETLGDGWHALTVGIKNRSPYPVRAESLTVLRPWRGRLVTYEDGAPLDDYGQPVFKAETAARHTRRSIPMQMRVAAGASHAEEAFLWVPGTWPRFMASFSSIKLCFAFASSRATMRRSVIVLNSTVTTNSKRIRA